MLLVLKRQPGSSISPKEMETAVIPGYYKFINWLSADRYMATEREGIAPMKAFSQQDGDIRVRAPLRLQRGDGGGPGQRADLRFGSAPGLFLDDDVDHVGTGQRRAASAS